MDEDDHQALIDYHILGEAVNLAIPTPEHYLPMLYALALKQEGETPQYYNDVAVAGSLTMTSFIIR
jgi:4,5-DOPA dioxygenase extradiol